LFKFSIFNIVTYAQSTGAIVAVIIW